jgi:hypothetical protein
MSALNYSLKSINAEMIKDTIITLKAMLILIIQCGNYLWNKFSNFKTNDIYRKR